MGVIHCSCGGHPLPMPSIGGDVVCLCGMRFSVTVDGAAMYRRQQMLQCTVRDLDAKLTAAKAALEGER